MRNTKCNVRFFTDSSTGIELSLSVATVGYISISMNEHNKGLFPLILVLSILAVCGSFFGLIMWLSQPSIPSDMRIAGEARSGPVTGALDAIDSIPDGQYAYSGSATMVPIRQAIESLIQAEASEFQLQYLNPVTGPNSTRGIDLLITREVAFVDSSRPIKPEEYKAAERLGIELQQTPVAIDGIAITVHPDLDIEGLTLAQLSDIFLGNVTNWSEVGGPDLEIRPYSMPPSTSGTASFFIRRILKGSPLAERVEIAAETTPALRTIASTPGSIYYASAPLAVPQCSVKTLPIATAEGRPYVAPYDSPQVSAADCPNQRNQINKDAFKNGTYPLIRRLFVITAQGESADIEAGKAYSDILLSAEGQTLVEEAGFVATR